MEDSGYKVIEASGGSSGLAQFREKKPDLVLCDLRMPDMDGLQLLEVMTREVPEMPIIVISGAGLIHDVVEALHFFTRVPAGIFSPIKPVGASGFWREVPVD